MHAERTRFSISIIVPVYNEGGNIYTFYQRMINVLAQLGMPYEIIFINDGSKDNSAEHILALREKNACVKLINLSRNFGKEIASTAGLDYATGDIIVPIDADLQDPPELIIRMVQAWQAGYDVVYATRKGRAGESFLKKITAHLFYKVLNALSEINIPENTGDFRLFSRQVLQSLKQVREKCRFMKGIYSWVGFRQTAIFYERHARSKGHSKWTYAKLWRLAIEGITAYSTVPLQFATYLGCLTACGAFVYSIIFLFKTLFFGNAVPGYPSLLIFLLFFSSVQLIALGIIGEYVGRIYLESKDRPLYIAQNAFGFEAVAVNSMNAVSTPQTTSTIA
jgi:glycosyltransferase involved in cell wall biosynthesis